MITRMVLLAVLPLMLFSCSGKDDGAVTAPENPPGFWQPSLKMALYGSYLDSLYTKTWSDSSYERFVEAKIQFGIQYLITENSAGNRFYYSASGYAGFQLVGESPIIFDAPLRMRDSLFYGMTGGGQTTFFYKGYSYTLLQEYTLRDTVQLALPFGQFNTCAWLTAKVTLSAGGQSDVSTSDVWLAIGPSAVKEVKATGSAVLMVRGRVNGKGWGMPFPKADGSASLPGTQSASRREFIETVIDVHRLLLISPK
ncbi:MAG: hypothetical protein IPI01_06440 [Ignavibacteriae bacterium]|nr:hypothetical protein [Ignavibacteriota bacterium]